MLLYIKLYSITPSLRRSSQRSPTRGFSRILFPDSFLSYFWFTKRNFFTSVVKHRVPTPTYTCYCAISRSQYFRRTCIQSTDPFASPSRTDRWSGKRTPESKSRLWCTRRIVSSYVAYCSPEDSVKLKILHGPNALSSSLLLSKKKIFSTNIFHHEHKWHKVHGEMYNN